MSRHAENCLRELALHADEYWYDSPLEDYLREAVPDNQAEFFQQFPTPEDAVVDFLTWIEDNQYNGPDGKPL